MEAFHKLVGRLAALLALAGGGVLVLLVALTCVSIAGRSLLFAGLGPIPGDVELIELGIAFAVFSFFPWCQYTQGHARVELFKRFFNRTTSWVSDVIADLLMLVVSVVIGWCLYQGMLDKFEYTETTFILRLSLGWGYAFCLVGAFAFVLVTASCLVRTLTLKRPNASKRSLT
jgi:TRAP-type C4-dicarboxylate transport system permease small subunit